MSEREVVKLLEESEGYTISPSLVMPPTDPYWPEARERVVEVVSGLRDALDASLAREEALRQTLRGVQSLLEVRQQDYDYPRWIQNTIESIEVATGDAWLGASRSEAREEET